jgi:hypothetical protein
MTDKELDELWEATGMEPTKLIGEDPEDFTTPEEIGEVLAAFRELDDHDDHQAPDESEEQ